MQQALIAGDCGPGYRSDQQLYTKFRSDDDEKGVIERIIQGERELFADLVEPHRRLMLLTALKQVRDVEKAEDAVQESMYKALTRLHQFRGDSEFVTWLIRILINECRMQYRSNRRYADSELAQSADSVAPFSAVPSEAPSVLEELLREESKRSLLSEVAKLPRKFRQVVILRDLRKLSITETAAQLSLTAAAVKSRHFRARQMLQRSIVLNEKHKTRPQ